MTTTPKSVEELLLQLSHDGHEVPDRAAIDAALPPQDTTPWFVQPFIFLGAFLAAGTFIGGLMAMFGFHRDDSEMLLLGVALIALALFTNRRGSDTFLRFLALALSMGGTTLVLIGTSGLNQGPHDGLAVLAAATLLCVALYIPHRDFLRRFLTSLLVVCIAKFALPAAHWGDGLHVIVLVLIVTASYLLTRPRGLPTWRPLGYACAWGLLIVLLPLGERGLWSKDAELGHRIVSSVSCALALLWACSWAARREGLRVTVARASLAVIVATGLAALQTPGIPAALFLIVLGYASGHWQICAVALGVFPLFVYKYYYNLDVDFLTKSAVLAGSGVLLLCVRWFAARSSPAVGASAPEASP